MKKFAFSILPALLLALVSCMNMSSGSEGGSVRVVLPSSSRALYSSGHGDVDSFTVRLLLGEKIINEKSLTKETADTGGGNCIWRTWACHIHSRSRRLDVQQRCSFIFWNRRSKGNSRTRFWLPSKFKEKRLPNLQYFS